jgi:hypothetical protein
VAKFDFLLVGSSCCHRLDVAAGDLADIVAEVESTRFLSGELEPDEWGQVRRAAIRSDRIQIIVEAD